MQLPAGLPTRTDRRRPGPEHPLDAQLLAILTTPLKPNETAMSEYERKERLLASCFARSARVDASALYPRIAQPVASDLLAIRFARLPAARRARLLALLEQRMGEASCPPDERTGEATAGGPVSGARHPECQQVPGHEIADGDNNRAFTAFDALPSQHHDDTSSSPLISPATHQHDSRIDHALDDAHAIAILTAPLRPGNTARLGFALKEGELATVFEALSVSAAYALRKRLACSRSSDELAQVFSRLTVERRTRLFQILLDAGRRAAMRTAR